MATRRKEAPRAAALHVLHALRPRRSAAGLQLFAWQPPLS